MSNDDTRVHSELPDRHLVLRRPWWAVERTAERYDAPSMSALFWLADGQPWMEQATCARTGHPDAWFAQGDGTGNDAKARVICHHCPVQQACLAYALNAERNGEHLEGLWGGWSANQRRQLVRAERKHYPLRPQQQQPKGATA